VTSDVVTIAGRFNGPPGTANGGYTCGLVAAAIGPAATVRLLSPPPLDVALERRREADGTVRLLDGDVAVAEGRSARPTVDVPAPPALDIATRAAGAFAGFETHAFPTCFVCGPRRADDDGLDIFPGLAGPDGLLACSWTPAEDLADDGIVDPRFAWAALDCPSGFACIPPGTTTVLATMTAALEADLHAGRPYVVTGWPLGSEGRKHHAASALHTAGGERVAVAEALWITLRDGDGRPLP
jgi:hypothetical protein